MPVSTFVAGRAASAARAGQLAAFVVLPQPKKNGNALNELRLKR